MIGEENKMEEQVPEKQGKKVDETMGNGESEKVEKTGENKQEVKGVEENKEEKKKSESTGKPEEKKDDKKTKKQEIKPKENAKIDVKSLALSPKYCFAICKMIKGKTPEQAVERLDLVIKEKKAVPMKGEIPHRKGEGMMSGRFPKKASLEIIKLLKQLSANALVNGIENPIITIAKADRAPRPFRKQGRRAKRVHIYLEVKNKLEKENVKAN